MKTLANLFATLFIIVFVLVAQVALVLNTIQYQLLDADIYKDKFAQHDLYQVATVALAQEFGNTTAIESALDAEEYQVLVNNLIPQSYMQEAVESVTDQIFDYLNSRGQSDVLVLGTATLHTHLATVSAETVCAPITRPEFQTICLENAAQILLDMQAAVPPNQHVVDTWATLLPNGGDLQASITYMSTFAQNTLWVCGLILLLILIIVVRSVQGLLRWWGVSFLLTGLLGFLVTFGLFSLFESVIDDQLATPPPNGLPQDIFIALIDMLTSIANRFSISIGIGAALFFIIGVGMWVMSVTTTRPTT